MSSVSLVSSPLDAGLLNRSLIPSFTSFNPLSGRLNVNWQDLVLVAGTAVAISGAVISFFAAANIVAAAFACVALTCGFGAYFVHKFKDDEVARQHEIAELKQRNTELQTTQRTHQATITQLNQHHVDAQNGNRRLVQTVADLEGRVQAEQRANADLAQNNQNLTDTILQLRRDGADLQHKITTLRQAISQHSDQVNMFAIDTMLKGKLSHEIDIDVAAIEERNRNLEQTVPGIDATLNPEIINLKNGINFAQEVAKDLIAKLGEQKDRFAVESHQLREEKKELMASIQHLPYTEATLKGLNNMLQQKELELENLNKKLLDTRIGLRAEKKTLEDEIQKLTVEHQRLLRTVEEMRAIDEQLQKLPGQLLEEKRQIDEEIDSIKEEKAALLQNFDNEIKEKNAEIKRLSEILVKMQIDSTQTSNALRDKKAELEKLEPLVDTKKKELEGMLPK